MAHDPVYLAHDYLTQQGGAERVALELAQALRPRLIFTSVYCPEQTFSGFSSHPVATTPLQRSKRARHDPRAFLPLLALAWRTFDPLPQNSVVVCSSSGWSHSIRTRGRKVVYCHNPARWLYQPDDYFGQKLRPLKPILKPLLALLRRWDRRHAQTADIYLANSTSVALRIKSAYEIDPQVVFPPVAVDTSAPRAAVPGLESGYFLTVGRGRGYKGVGPLIEAFRQLPSERLVIVGGDARTTAPNITALGRVSEDALRWLYENAAALVSVSHEDFGLTPIEANAFGTPTLLLRAGGFLDSTVEGRSGLFIETDDPSSIKRAVENFPRRWDRTAVTENARRFSREAFREAVLQVVAHLPSPGRP